MVEDRKIAWPAQLSLGSDGMGNSLEHVRQDHGPVDGVADPPLQAGHRGLPGAGRARSTSPIESPARRARLPRGHRRRHPAVARARARAQLREPAGDAGDERGRHDRRRHRRRRLDRPGDGGSGPMSALPGSAEADGGRPGSTRARCEPGRRPTCRR